MYIFPVLKPGITPKRERELIQLQTRLINDHMKKIAPDLDIMTNITTYVARGLFCDRIEALRCQCGLNFRIIRALKIKNDTKSYLPGFEDDKKREVARALTAFKDVV